MLTEFLKLFFSGWVFAGLFMVVTFIVSRRIKNTGIVDVAWSIGFAPVAIFYAAFSHGDLTRRWLIAGMATLWSVRLGAHIAARVKHSHPKEDERYHKLREEWGAQEAQKMFGFFQVQAALLIVLSVPFLLACMNGRTGISVFEMVGVAVWFIAVGGESLSDHQLKQFKAEPKNKGHVCQAGLWHYSRHPNYFFEWLIWMGYFIFALGSPWGWITVYCPALMLFFLLKVTGIPMTEELSVKNRGDEYRQYQKTTSAFVPWFRKG
jgi:steroid 5-alpha reductase family enzyme